MSASTSTTSATASKTEQISPQDFKFPPPKATSSPSSYANGKTLWRDASKRLAALGLHDFQQLRVCCPACMGGRSVCESCAGCGYVCPACLGARWLKYYLQNGAPALMRCQSCGYDTSQGWEYDAERELEAVEAWLEAWGGD